MKTHEWSPRRRGMALGLMRGKRHTLADISRITNIPKGTLNGIKKRDRVISKSRNGRPVKLTSRDKCHIEMYIRTNHSTRRKKLSDIIRTLQLDVSDVMLRKALNEFGYHHRIARRCVFLNKRDRKRRLQFAKRHVHWTAEDWYRVIWTDEMSIKLYMARHSKDYVWRKEGEEFHPDCINYSCRNRNYVLGCI
jgi:Transposase